MEPVGLKAAMEGQRNSPARMLLHSQHYRVAAARTSPIPCMQDILAKPPPFGVDWEWMHVTAFAASSPTPDWREKVEWLEEQGHDKNAWAAERVVRCVC